MSESATRLRASSVINTSIKSSDRTTRKIPLKTMTYFGRSGAAVSLLPTHQNADITPTIAKVSPSQYHTFKASEKGNKDVLPTLTISRSKSVTCDSLREGYATDSSWYCRRSSDHSTEGRADRITQKLRSRRNTASSDDLGGLLSEDNSYHRRSLSTKQKKNWVPDGSSGSNVSPDKFDSYTYTAANKARQDEFFTVKRLLLLVPRECVQIIVLCIIAFLVFDSYIKAMATSKRLDLFHLQESRMMMHLQRVEQHSLQLHENMARLSDVADMVATPNNAAARLQGQTIDSNLMREQTQQLQEMEAELDHELQSLQAKIQNVARSSIIRTYGEGPVQVALDLNFPGGSSEPGMHNMITILLWYDTPHAAWTLLQQINRGEWNGAPFGSNRGGTLDVKPTIGNVGSLDFLEKSQKQHEAWTVGLTDMGSSLGMFINLQDNTTTRKRDVCVGKVIDGFDALQRLIDTSRLNNGRRPVTIKKATASHLTTHDRF